MATVLKEIQTNGICLMDGRESAVRILPSVKKGIFFYPNNGDIAIKAGIETVISTQNCTVLGDNDLQIRVVEHFLAACAFAGIDSLEVYLSSSELPILDGSAINWLRLFKDAGISEYQILKTEFASPITLSSGTTNITLIPAEEFKVTYCVNFNHPDLSRKWYSWELTQGIDIIAESRTFGYFKDLERLQSMGLGLGANVDNIVGLTDDKYTTELRSVDEPIKHKILDLIGDFYLLGINPLGFKAHIIAQEAGHKTHVEFTRLMEKELCQQVRN